MKLTEVVTFDGAEFVEEAGKRIVKNVVMLGPQSSHGYSYRQEAMAKAVQGGLYEGVRIFINHAAPGEKRDLMHLAGVFRDARHEGGKIRGNAHLLDDAYGRKFWDIAKTVPEAAGCSHVADGKLVRNPSDGKSYVEEISKVYSVDLVVQGATTRNVFEAQLAEGNIPRPARKERQHEFIARCIPAVKGQYQGLNDEGAVAMCFLSWQNRFEQGGMVDDLMPEPAKEVQNETISSSLEERTPHMDIVEEKFGGLEKTAGEAKNLLTADPARESIIRQSMEQDQDDEYRKRQDARPGQRQIAEVQNVLQVGRRETDGEFETRMREEDGVRHPEKHLSARELAELHDCLKISSAAGLAR